MTIYAIIADSYKKVLADADLDWAAGDVRAMLVKVDTWDPYDQTGYTTVADILGAGAIEVSTTGYARKALSGKATSRDDGSQRALLDCDDIVFDGPPDPADDYDALVIFQHVTNDSDSPILATFSLSLTFTTDGNPITFRPAVDGLFAIS